MNQKYQAAGAEVEFEPGSRGRVLRNSLGITRVREMNVAEFQALELAQDLALDRDYAPLTRTFRRAIAKSTRRASSSARRTL